MNIVIRQATALDADALVKLRALMFDSMGTPHNDRWQAGATKWFHTACSDADVRVLVADQDGEVVACGMGSVQRSVPSPGTPSGVGVYLGNFATLPSARGQGLARQILSELLAWAAGVGADRAELHASAMGRPIYESFGFVETACPSMRLSLSH